MNDKLEKALNQIVNLLSSMYDKLQDIETQLKNKRNNYE